MTYAISDHNPAENQTAAIPVIVAAMRWTPENPNALGHLRRWAQENGAIRTKAVEGNAVTRPRLKVQSFDSTVIVTEGDWLFRVAYGMFRLVKHDQFVEHYVATDAESTTIERTSS